MEPLADITVTAPDADWLVDLTHQLVEQRLVACGNVIPGVRSTYRWAGQIEQADEAVVLLHTRVALVPQVIAAVEAQHPYTTPQVVALPVLAANPAYHQWVLDSTAAIG